MPEDTETHEHAPDESHVMMDFVRDYANRTTVQIQFGEPHIDDESWVMVIDAESTWPRDWIDEQVLSLAVDDDACCGPGSFVMNTQKNSMNWGAQGAVYEIVLSVALGVLSSAAWDQLKEVARQVNERLGYEPVAVSLDTVEAEGLFALTTRGIGARDEFTVLSVGLEDGIGTVEVKHDEGTLYSLTVEHVGIIPVVKIKKKTYQAGQG